MTTPYYAGHYAGQARGHCTCGGCRTVLEYPQGARNVRCSVCGYINHVAMLWPGLTPAQEYARSRDLSQLICRGCHTTLLYPHGASAVQCAVCRTLNPARQQQQQPSNWSTLTCGGCRQPLTYTSGAEYVRCAACQFMNRAPRSPKPEAPAPAPQVKTVIVENPPLLDENGDEVPQLVLGVTFIEDKSGTPK